MISLNEFEQLIKTRRSIRKFQDKQVPNDLLMKALELATWAPNSGNKQMWRFCIVSNKELIQKMGDAVKSKAELIASWPEAEQFEETVAGWRQNCDFFREAPVCIVVFMGKYSSHADQILRVRGETDPIAREMISYRETGKSSLQSSAAAVAYLCLVLHSFGLGTTWMVGPLQAKKEIEQLLNVSSEWEFVSLIPVGYAAESPEVRLRKPIKNVTQFFC